jgi:hypothetical protein
MKIFKNNNIARRKFIDASQTVMSSVLPYPSPNIFFDNNVFFGTTNILSA